MKNKTEVIIVMWESKVQNSLYFANIRALFNYLRTAFPDHYFDVDIHPLLDVPTVFVLERKHDD